jgi:hypothetical protein
MIELVYGEGVGAGKSFYVMARRVIPHLVRGGTVYHSDTFQPNFDALKKHCEEEYSTVIEPDQLCAFQEKDVPRLHEVTRMGTPDLPVLIVVDEAQGELPAISQSTRQKDEFFNWLCQSRHDDNDVIFITQEIENVAVKIRRLCTYVVVVRNMVNFKVGGLRWPLRQFRVQWKDRKMKVVQQVEWLWHSKELFGCYESKACRGRHKRDGAPVGRKTLAKVKSRRRRMKIMLVFVVAAITFAVWQITEFKAKAKESEAMYQKNLAKVSASVSPTGESETSRQTKKKWNILREPYRYTNGTSEMRTTGGMYVAGEICHLGIVKRVQGRVALVETPDGDLVTVVGTEEAVPYAPSPASGVVSPAAAVEMKTSSIEGSKPQEYVGARWEPNRSAWIEADEARMDAERARPIGTFASH